VGLTLLSDLGYPNRALSPWGGACGGVAAANAFSVASSRASSARSTASVPGTRRSAGAHPCRSRSYCRRSGRTRRHWARFFSQKGNSTPRAYGAQPCSGLTHPMARVTCALPGAPLSQKHHPATRLRLDDLGADHTA